jgi:flagellar biosynthesis/type III secretory pathway chaperone
MPADPIEDLQKARRLASSLKSVLDAEFEALKNSDTDKFESLQADKLNLLEDLSHTEAIALLETEDWRLAHQELNELADEMNLCRDKFHRNEILVRSKLDSIKAALNTLRGSSDASSVELYNKLGMLGKRRK